MKGSVFFARKTVTDVVFNAANSIFMILVSITFLYPVWNTIIISFSTTPDATALGFHLWLKEWSYNAYWFSFSKYGQVGTAYVNSIFRTTVGTLLIIAVTFAGAYPLSKKRLPGRKIMTMYLLITMFFSGGLIPTYFLIRRVGLLNSRMVYILPILVNGFYIIITRNFLMTIDTAYEDAAIMDGAGYIYILVKIIVPLAKPVLAVVALWAAVQHWNAWFDALIYIKSESKVVLQLLLYRVLRDAAYANDNPMAQFFDLTGTTFPTAAVRAAVTVVTIGPIIIAYPFFQRYFVKGIYIGSLKG